MALKGTPRRSSEHKLWALQTQQFINRLDLSFPSPVPFIAVWLSKRSSRAREKIDETQVSQTINRGVCPEKPRDVRLISSSKVLGNSREPFDMFAYINALTLHEGDKPKLLNHGRVLLLLLFKSSTRQRQVSVFMEYSRNPHELPFKQFSRRNNSKKFVQSRRLISWDIDDA